MTEKIRANILRSEIAALKKLPNVVGGGVGKRIKNGQATEEDVIHILVTKKESGKSVPANLGGFATDVVQVGYIKALSNRDVFRPIVGGVSISNPISQATGTLSGIFKDRTDGKPVMVSNNHVMARGNQANLGETINQPSPFEGIPGSAGVGTLKRFTRILQEPSINQVDGAVADLSASLRSNYEIGITHIGPIRSVVDDVPINKIVQKSGRSSEVSLGAVLSKHVIVGVDYGDFGAVFTEQILTTNMLIPGDSGSLLMSLTGELIGLGFAGSDDSSVFIPANIFLQNLNISPYLPVQIVAFKNPSLGAYYYKLRTDANQDSNYATNLGTPFYLYPSDNNPNTISLIRFKTRTTPTRYALSTTLPGSNFVPDTIVGKIATRQLSGSLPLVEWIDNAGNRFYTTDSNGGGINTNIFRPRTTVGFAVPIMTPSFSV